MVFRTKILISSGLIISFLGYNKNFILLNIVDICGEKNIQLSRTMKQILIHDRILIDLYKSSFSYTPTPYYFEKIYFLRKYSHIKKYLTEKHYIKFQSYYISNIRPNTMYVNSYDCKDTCKNILTRK